MKNFLFASLLVIIGTEAFAQQEHAHAIEVGTSLYPLENTLSMKDGTELHIFTLQIESRKRSSRKKGRVIISKGDEMFNEAKKARDKNSSTFRCYAGRLHRKGVKQIIDQIAEDETDLYLVTYLKKNRVYLAASMSKTH